MISLVATVRAPAADLTRFVAYHLNVGVSHIYLFFDDPEDPALDAVSALESVTAVACTRDHWRGAGLTPHAGIEARQTYNATLALGWARARGRGWLLHLDSDELIYRPDGDLSGWLGRRPAECEAVSFPVLEAVPRARERGHVFEDCRLFKSNAESHRLDWARRAGCRRALRYGYFRGHTVGKAATRLESGVDRVGIHLPERLDGATVQVETAADAFVLHYDGCTFEAWRQKWARRRDGSGLALNMRPSRRRQFEDFLVADSRGSTAELRREFRRQCLIPAHERAVLRLFGLARLIRLQPCLFVSPSVHPSRA